MNRKITLSIVVLLILISSVFTTVSFAQESDELHISNGGGYAYSIYHKASDQLISVSDGVLYAYDQSGNQVWSTGTGAEDYNIAGLHYSPQTENIYLFNNEFEGADIRVYDSDGNRVNTLPFNDRPTDAFDDKAGTLYGYAGDFDWQILDIETGNSQYQFSNGRDVLAIDESENYALTARGHISSSNGHDEFHVYDYTTGNQIAAHSTSPSQSQLTGADYWEINSEYVVLERGMYAISDGDRVVGWGTPDSTDLHPDENVAYTADNGEITAYSESGDVLGTDSIPSGFTNSLEAQYIDGELRLVYANDNGVGYITPASAPQISGTVTDSSYEENPIHNANISLYDESGTFVGGVQTRENGDYSLSVASGNYTIEANKSGWTSETKEINLTTDQTVNFMLRNKSDIFQFKVSNFMEHGSTQEYSAVFDRPGSSTLQGVTAETSVSSENDSIVSVDSTNNSLIATSDVSVNNRTTITAEYVRDNQTFITTEQITVANRTMENIEIMPPSQYIPAALGFGEEDTVFGIGSEIQWVLLAIFIGSGAAWMARNEWLGVGIIVAAISFFWVLGNVSLGITMVGVFYGLFVGYQLNKIPGRSDTNVGGGNDTQPPEPPQQ